MHNSLPHTAPSQMQATHERADSLTVSALLAVVGGFLDAYTYILRGGVLANAQTGNLVFVAIRLTEGAFLKAFLSLIPVIFFIIGVFWVEKLRFKRHTPQLLHWQQMILVIELVILLLLSFIPMGPLDTAVNIAISLICSIQIQSFRSLRGNPFASTMCTGNLRSGSEAFFLYTQLGDRDQLRTALHYFGIIGYFLIGVATGAFFSHLLLEKATFICCAILFICLMLLRHKEKEERK